MRVAPTEALERALPPAEGPWLLRYGAYTVVLAGWLQGLLYAASRDDGHKLFREGALAENLQVALAAGTTTCLLLGAIFLPASRAILLVLAALAAVAVGREMDSLLDRNLALLGWKATLLPSLALIAMVLLRSGRSFWRQLRHWQGAPAAAWLWFGFFLIVVLAQLIGQADVWRAIIGPDYRDFKRTVEETTESVGYAVLLLGSIEAVLHARRIQRTANAAVEEDADPHAAPAEARVLPRVAAEQQAIDNRPAPRKSA